MKTTARLSDRVTGLYCNLGFVGTVSAVSGRHTIITLTAPLLREDGSVKYPVGEDIALAPWQTSSLRVVERGTATAEDIRYEQGHAWV